MSRFTPALLSDCLFRRCITTAHACPYRKAEGCGGEDSGDSGHDVIPLGDLAEYLGGIYKGINILAIV